MNLTPFNHHEWKAAIGILLHSKWLYRVTLALENEPNAVIEKAQWRNRLDEAYGLLRLSISPDLLFHLDGLTSPNLSYRKRLSGTQETTFQVFDTDSGTKQVGNDVDPFRLKLIRICWSGYGSAGMGNKFVGFRNGSTNFWYGSCLGEYGSWEIDTDSII